MVNMKCIAQINIWEGTSCNETVEMTPYLVEGDNNIAIIAITNSIERKCWNFASQAKCLKGSNRLGWALACLW